MPYTVISIRSLDRAATESPIADVKTFLSPALAKLSNHWLPSAVKKRNLCSIDILRELKKRQVVKDMVEQAEAEHGVVKQLLREMGNQEGEEFEKNFQALLANVQLHVTEEENQMFPRIAKANGELDLGKIGQELREEKRKYSETGANGSQTRMADLKTPKGVSSGT
jgi:hemerythrin superfamily protein